MTTTKTEAATGRRDADKLTGLRHRPLGGTFRPPASIGVAAQTDRDRQRWGRPVIILDDNDYTTNDNKTTTRILPHNISLGPSCCHVKTAGVSFLGG